MTLALIVLRLKGGLQALWKLKCSDTIALAALLVSIVSLCFTYRNAVNMVRPTLSLIKGYSETNPEWYGVFVRNVGVGTASINRVEIVYNGENLGENIQAAVDTIQKRVFANRPLDFSIRSARLTDGRILGPNQEFPVFSTKKADIQDIAEFNDVMNTLDLNVKYSSINKERYCILPAKH